MTRSHAAHSPSSRRMHGYRIVAALAGPVATALVLACGSTSDSTGNFGPGTGGSGADGGVAGNGNDGGPVGPDGSFPNPDATASCSADDDCIGTLGTPWCDIVAGVCVACNQDDPAQPCSGGATCCGRACVDLQSSAEHCGACGSPCELPGATAACAGGTCTFVACEAGRENCDNDDSNGCETLSSAGCACTPGIMEPCYSGPAGTQDVGACRGGLRLCNDNGNGYGACDGELIPAWEVCGNGVDEDCNGTPDDSPDLDGDGWRVCDGDCCDKIGTACGSPGLVNPGAIEVQGDSVDNDCDGVTDEDPLSNCSAAAMFLGTTAWDLVHAMDLCEVSTNGSWGVVGTPTLTKASGAGSLDNRQISVMQQFGTDPSNLPRFGATMASLSSGNARDADDPDPTNTLSFTFSGGSPPPDFVAPHGGALPTTAAGCPNGNSANDDAMLTVQLKAPSNANSFTFNFRFFSQEYWTYTCTQYNDFFITMLDSAWQPAPGQTPIPPDKNICFDANGGYISVNTQQFFTVCPPKSGYPCPDGTAGLTSTGYTLGPGGGTMWLTTTAPVVPGETITLRFAIWDTSDMLLDSIVLIDNFRWSAEPSDGPITEK